MDKNPVIVIVGAGKGISFSVAKKFGLNGYRVVLVSRSQQNLDQYVSALTSAQIEAFGVAADATDTTSLKYVFDQIKSEFDWPEVLVYNAAHITSGTPLGLLEQQLIDDLKVNVVGALTSVQQVVPRMIEKGKGSIFITGGSIALHPRKEAASLSIGKGAVRTLAYMLADELSAYGIYVGTVTISGRVEPGTDYDPEKIANIYWDMHVSKDQTEYVY
jgi:short-subunit dehydrogenase